MSHIRFRIRTIMMVTAAVAVLMGLLMNFGLVATTTTVFLVGSLVEFSAFSFHLWRSPKRPPQFPRNANRQIVRPQPNLSGEPNKNDGRASSPDLSRINGARATRTSR